MPPDKMSQNEEKHAQDQILIWSILMALIRILNTSILLNDPVVGYIEKQATLDTIYQSPYIIFSTHITACRGYCHLKIPPTSSLEKA